MSIGLTSTRSDVHDDAASITFGRLQVQAEVTFVDWFSLVWVKGMWSRQGVHSACLFVFPATRTLCSISRRPVHAPRSPHSTAVVKSLHPQLLWYHLWGLHDQV